MREPFPLFLVVIIACAYSLENAPRAEQVEVSEWDWELENIGAPLNSFAHDGFPSILPDGLTIYFASDRHSYDDHAFELRPRNDADWDIYVATRGSRDHPWGEPVRLGPHINTPAVDHSVTLSPDRLRLYFGSDRPGGCGGLDLYVSEREDLSDPTSWGEPQNLGCTLNSTANDICAIYHPEGDEGQAELYFVSSRDGGLGSLDIYRSSWNEAAGEFGPANLLRAVSSQSLDAHLDPVGGFIWSRREGGLGGSDLWHAARGPNGEWLEPVHAGPALNSEFEEQLPSPLDGGRILFFPSDRPGGLGGLDLYRAVAR